MSSEDASPPDSKGSVGDKNPFAAAESPREAAVIGAEPAGSGAPDDITEEQALYARLRREPGWFKPRDKAPNLFVTAWRTPGELAVMGLSVAYYAITLALTVILGGESVTRLPGIFQCGLLALAVIPAYMLGGGTWRAMGRAGRDRVRLCIRFWPVTLPVAVMIAGAVKRLVGAG